MKRSEFLKFLTESIKNGISPEEILREIETKFEIPIDITKSKFNFPIPGLKESIEWDSE